MRNILRLMLVCAFAVPVGKQDRAVINKTKISFTPDPVVPEEQEEECDRVIESTKKKRLVRLFRRR